MKMEYLLQKMEEYLAGESIGDESGELFKEIVSFVIFGMQSACKKKIRIISNVFLINQR